MFRGLLPSRWYCFVQIPASRAIRVWRFGISLFGAQSYFWLLLCHCPAIHAFIGSTRKLDALQYPSSQNDVTDFRLPGNTVQLAVDRSLFRGSLRAIDASGGVISCEASDRSLLLSTSKCRNLHYLRLASNPISVKFLVTLSNENSTIGTRAQEFVFKTHHYLEKCHHHVSPPSPTFPKTSP